MQPMQYWLAVEFPFQRDPKTRIPPKLFQDYNICVFVESPWAIDENLPYPTTKTLNRFGDKKKGEDKQIKENPSK